MLPVAAMVAAPTFVPVDLRCESLTDPQGIGRDKPLLSWKLRAAKKDLKNLHQSAYRVLVASDPTLLKEGKADLWDSARVDSGAQYGIEYAGQPLGSGKAAWWSVQTWDGVGVASIWSPAAHFSTGLLKQSDWTAQWIGYDAPTALDKAARPFDGASWVWSAKDTAGEVGLVSRTFVRRFDISGMVKEAAIAVTADDQFTLLVNGHEVAKSSGQTDAWKMPVMVDVAKYLKTGSNEVVVEARNTEQGPAGMLAKLAMKTSSGDQAIVSDGEWMEDGGAVKVLGVYGIAPWGRFGEGKAVYPSTLYRKEFAARPKLKRAMAYVSALGLVDLHLNGKRVSEDLFSPGWTDYKKRVYAKAYDVTAMIRPGSNAVGAEVGDGWYSGYVGYSRQRAHYGDRPRVRVQLDLEYADGHHDIVGTGVDWQASTGATTVQDFLVGEEYDARLAQPWATAGFAATDWVKPQVIGEEAQVDPWVGVPVRPYDTRKAISVKREGDGTIMDFGQNLAGFARLKMRGKAGEKISLEFIEVLNPDGTPYTANLRSARAVDTYTFKGEGVEEWSPRFTFHGFRYIKVTGLGRAPRRNEIMAVAISSATPETGHIETSDAMINKLAKNAWWTQKMNFIDVPTDCPQRDERLGWTGDAQAYIRTAATYSDVQSFFDKWLVTLEDAQTADGNFPQFAPTIMGGTNGGPAWADAGVICPWTIYDVYGDKRLLAERYDSMKRFVEFTRDRSTKDLLPPKSYHIFGDWLSINANTPNDVIYEAYFAGSARLVARAARVLGKTEDAETYEKLYRDVRAAFNRAYVSPDGKVEGDTQTAYVLALAFDLLDEAKAKQAAAHLVENIEGKNTHLSTGFVGTRDLMTVLSKIGRDDIAFKLLHNTTFPSWGFEIANGATTVWERWDGYTPEKGFQDPGMNSFAHYAYGAVMGWVFQTIGGIDNLAPGFEKIVIAPRLDPKLTWAKTSYDSVRGPVRTEWHREGDRVRLTVEVPPNATAEIHVPGGGVETVGSGTYHYEAGPR